MKKLLIIILIPFITHSQDDSWKHVYACWAITHAIGWGVYYGTDRIGVSCGAGAAGALSVGAFKEYVWDGMWHRGVKSNLDMADNAWGVGLGTMTFRVAIDVKENSREIDTALYNFNAQYVEVPVIRGRKKWSFKRLRLLR